MVLKALTNGELPIKPARRGDPEIFDLIWRFCCTCWKKDARSRPNAGEAVRMWSTDRRDRNCELYQSPPLFYVLKFC